MALVTAFLCLHCVFGAEAPPGTGSARSTPERAEGAGHLGRLTGDIESWSFGPIITQSSIMRLPAAQRAEAEKELDKARTALGTLSELAELLSNNGIPREDVQHVLDVLDGLNEKALSPDKLGAGNIVLSNASSWLVSGVLFQIVGSDDQNEDGKNYDHLKQVTARHCRRLQDRLSAEVLKMIVTEETGKEPISEDGSVVSLLLHIGCDRQDRIDEARKKEAFPLRQLAVAISYSHRPPSTLRPELSELSPFPFAYFLLTSIHKACLAKLAVHWSSESRGAGKGREALQRFIDIRRQSLSAFETEHLISKGLTAQTELQHDFELFEIVKHEIETRGEAILTVARHYLRPDRK
ncbi:MAG TPA: hypothetical protein VMX97_01565 [Hyphomicrobiaceae bacterium]|nr:hypothetical protein [Hyphomicrobiaceae bacterium]